ncbi:MAG: alginate export family protein, partial [Pseudomonadota bacterium]
NLGSRRLVASDDFRNTTNSYAGVRADFAPAGVKTTLVYVQPRLRLPDGLDSVLDNAQRIDRQGRDLELWGGVAARPKTIGPATLEVAYIHLSERDRPNRPTRNRDLDTYGARLILDPKSGQFDYELEGLVQTGEIRAGTRPADPQMKVRATFVHADLGYSFAHPWKPRLSAELDIATGDEAGGRYGRFDTLFGMRRADFAPSGLYNAIGRANIVTPGLRLEVAPSPRWDAFLVGRGLWLEAKEDSFSTTGVRDASGRAGRFAGGQLEGRWRYWVVKDRLRAEVNGVWLIKDRFLRQAPNAPRNGNETYISTSLTVQFQ